MGFKAETGGAVEIFLHKKSETDNWECMVGGRVREGLVVNFANSNLVATILKNNNDATWLVSFNLSGPKFWTEINKVGTVPLPPYIKRNKKTASDKNNYQTVFANDAKIGSAAAPTAGLHFTEALLKKIKKAGVKIVSVTLHVGLGTFAPVKTAEILDHKMHSEYAEISAKTATAILRTKASGGRVIAVGTTSCRTLESANWQKFKDELTLGSVQSQAFWTDIFIYPGVKFKAVDALITNFHLPKSTLLMLVSALAGKKHIDAAYKEAVEHEYRFFSYGDAMFIY